MPVLVTAPDQSLSRRVATRLLDEGGEVRVFGSADTSSLRARGAFVATGDPDDEGRLEAALEQVHTVVHVEPVRWDVGPTQLVERARVVATAATNAGVERVITVSLPGAGAEAEDAQRRAAGEAERLLAEVPCPTVVIRSSLVDAPDLRDALATAGLDRELLATEVAPVREADLAEMVVAFDRARSRSSRGRLLVSADGPVRLSLGEYLQSVGVAPPGRGSLLGRRLAAEPSLERLRSLLDGPWWSDDADIVDGWGFAGLTPRAPGDGAE